MCMRHIQLSELLERLRDAPAQLIVVQNQPRNDAS
jgi:hypothetical protein